ncbi:MAG TPA: transglutaminaseTgpA domain-containing protein [Myxococcaceae bacterium]|nr:transglutaminaseTgpA domain-containing protein [Myxococcaceae bacterium]
MNGARDSSRLERLGEALPVLAALALHAVAHGRWMLALPVGLGLVFLALRGVDVAHTSGRLLAGAVLGTGAGALALLWGEPPPDSPVPPEVLSPLAGALVGLSAICTVTRRRVYAWIYAFILAVLSLDVPFRGGIVYALPALVLSLLAMVFLLDGPFRAGWRGRLGFALFFGVMLGLGAGSVVLIRASEGLLMNAVYEMMRDPDGASGPGLQTEIGLAAISKVRGGTRVLMEMSGDRPRRLRTMVFDQFNGLRWTTSSGLTNTVLRLPEPGAGTAGAFETELTLLEALGTVLPAPGGTLAVEGAQPQVIGGWVFRATKLEGLTLKIRADRGERLPPEPPPDPTLLSLPADLREELRPLAAELLRGARTPREMAETLSRKFQDEYEYSLDVNLGGTDHPLVVLIRDKKPAYCSYFASAMAALLRTQNVPARVVGGFAPQEENPLTGATVVRERDAHAWVEVYLADEGRFVAFDPTPWRSRDAALGMDEDKPGLAGNVFRAVQSFLRKLLAAVKADPSGYLWDLVKSPVFFVPAIALLLWRVVGRRRREQRKDGPRAALEGADPVVKAAYGQYLRVLKRVAGIVPLPAETDDEVLARLRESRGEQVAQVASEFIARYREARYRGTQVAPEPLAALVTKLGAELRREQRGR